MAVVGDIGAMGDLEQVLYRLAGVPADAARYVPARIRRAIMKQFRGGKDSYGKPWAKLAKSTLARGRHPPPLTDSTDLRESVRVFAFDKGRAAGVGITFGVDYASYHQTGTKHMPKRAILPDHGFPPKWEKILVMASERAIRAVLRKARGRTRSR